MRLAAVIVLTIVLDGVAAAQVRPEQRANDVELARVTSFAVFAATPESGMPADAMAGS